MKKIICLLCLCCLTMPTVAKEWVEIDYKTYANIKNVSGIDTYNRKVICGWVKKLNDGSMNKNIHYILTHACYDLTSKSYSVRQNITYDLKGNQIENYSVPDYGFMYMSFQSIPPGTNVEYYYEFWNNFYNSLVEHIGKPIFKKYK